MNAAGLWALVLAVGGGAIASLLLTGSSNLTVALALVATGLCILALVVDEPPPFKDRRPW